MAQSGQKEQKVLMGKNSKNVFSLLEKDRVYSFLSAAFFVNIRTPPLF